MAFTKEELISLAQSEYANIVQQRREKVEGWFMRMDGAVKATFEEALEEALEQHARELVTHAIDHVKPSGIFVLNVIELALKSWKACDEQVQSEYAAIDVFYGFCAILKEWGYEFPDQGKIEVEIQFNEVLPQRPEEADESAA